MGRQAEKGHEKSSSWIAVTKLIPEGGETEEGGGKRGLRLLFRHLRAHQQVRGGHEVLEEPEFGFVAPASEIEAEVLLKLLRVLVGDHHRTWSCSDGLAV